MVFVCVQNAFKLYHEIRFCIYTIASELAIEISNSNLIRESKERFQ